jgi:hypothetical protein
VRESCGGHCTHTCTGRRCRSGCALALDLAVATPPAVARTPAFLRPFQERFRLLMLQRRSPHLDSSIRRRCSPKKSGQNGALRAGERKRRVDKRELASRTGGEQDTFGLGRAPSPRPRDCCIPEPETAELRCRGSCFLHLFRLWGRKRRLPPPPTATGTAILGSTVLSVTC